MKELVENLKDFPIFQYWDINRRIFKPRALNQLSIRFNWSLDRAVDRINKDYEGSTEEDLIKYLAEKVVYAARYGLFGNACYEASGPNSYCGGNDSIQEQFVCWALDMTTEEYRAGGRSKSYSPELFEGPVLLEWVKNSELLKLVKSKLKK